MYRLISAVLLSVMVSGCMTTGTEALRDLPAEWPPLGATKDEVRTRLGAPAIESVSLHDGGQREVWSYTYGDTEVNPMLLLPGVGQLAAAIGEGVTGHGKDLIVTFDVEGKVVARSLTHQTIGHPWDGTLP
jgi:outer membrane protein assembly factor BamE (lipoprotein component of BamABCDE complex)